MAGMRGLTLSCALAIGCGGAVHSERQRDEPELERVAPRSRGVSPGPVVLSEVPEVRFGGPVRESNAIVAEPPTDAEGRVDATLLAWPDALDLSSPWGGGLHGFAAPASGWDSTLVAAPQADRLATTTPRGDVAVASIIDERCVLLARVEVDDPGYGSTAFKNGGFGDCSPVPTTWGAFHDLSLAASNEGVWMLGYGDGEEQWFRWFAPDHFDTGWQNDGTAPVSISVSSDLTGIALVDRDGLRFAPLFPSSAGEWQQSDERIVLAQAADMGGAQVTVLQRKGGDRYIGRYDNGAFLVEAELPDALNDVAVRLLRATSTGQFLIAGLASGDERQVVAAHFDSALSWVTARATAEPSGELHAALDAHGAVVSWASDGVLYALSNADFTRCSAPARGEWQALAPWAPAEGADLNARGGPHVTMSGAGPLAVWSTAAATRVVRLEPGAALLAAPLLPSAEVVALAAEASTITLVTGDEETARFSKASAAPCMR
jgi:hypothetical protein